MEGIINNNEAVLIILVACFLVHDWLPLSDGGHGQTATDEHQFVDTTIGYEGMYEHNMMIRVIV
jgi:hypothetical protein